MFTIPASHFGKNEKLNTANFPCLLEVFTVDGISGNNLVGALGNVTLICTGGWSNLGSNQFRRNAGTLSTSGTWPAIGTRDALLIKTGLFAAFSPGVSDTVAFGATAGTRLSVGASLTTSLAQLTSSSNQATVPGSTLAVQQKAAAIKLDQSTANGHAYGHWVGVDNSTEGPVIEGSLVGDISGTWPAFSTGASTATITPQADPQYYTGFYLLAFNTFPTDFLVVNAIKWMADNPKKLYPGFYHRS